MSGSKLFEPLKVGSLELKHRIAMAPLTRLRGTEDHVIKPTAVKYYGQRTSIPGTFIVSEATSITKQHGGLPNVPGIYDQVQIDAWRKITDGVHKNGSFIFCQLWAFGRAALKPVADAEGITIKSSSAIPINDDAPIPKEMTQDDISSTIASYVQAAKNAIAAGFDGVELHGANGYLIDQFTQDVCNKRTDQYGGSIENRSRFAIEVIQAVSDAIGADKTAIRLSPFSDFQGMKMADPLPQFTHLIQKINTFGLAYLHVVEARVAGVNDRTTDESLDPLIAHYTSGPLFIAGGFTAELAKAVVEKHKDRDVVVVFGRHFISNPDLVFRIRENIAFQPYNRATFYTSGEEGYVDYPFSKEFEERRANL